MIPILFALALMTIALSHGGQVPETVLDGSVDSLTVHHNKLDDIDSASEVETILTSIDPWYKNFKVYRSMRVAKRLFLKTDIRNQQLVDSLKVQAWTKADFDGNGYTDLLVVGKTYEHSILCIMDRGENQYHVIPITRRRVQEFTLPVVASIDNRPMILYYSRPSREWEIPEEKRSLVVDTLLYQFGDFIEFNSLPASHSIEKIEYSTGACYGTCPIFALTIRSDRSAMYHAEKYNKVSGEFTATIDTAQYHQLVDLLNYIDVASLDSSYAVDWTDDQTSTLTVTYDHGQTMKIQDYGLRGTFGLDRAYRLLFKLRENQDWK